MEQTEYQIFIILATIILLLFINGIIIFVFQYRKRKLAHDREKKVLNEVHEQELLSNQLEIKDQTMQDIGREIHDNVGQRLTLASIYVNQLVFENEYPGIKERMDQVGAIINESLADLRSLSKSLTNQGASMKELRDFIQNECKRINALGLCTATCSFDKTDFKLSATVKNFILRIVQEFIQNSLKHSDCRNITISSVYTPEGLHINAEDDGNGFDMTERKSEGIGLSNMKRRAELLGARFSIFSEKSKGTKINLFIPADKIYE